ncbi:hypothetical protein [Herbidospora cretacea]|uniref:hypothetical protein n=1 Tax=Herbidospora cretacea TaxID=28444 RepID=UPI0004C3D9CF|nr:hypothetical protein [Herbidospora cretacea]
MIELHHVDQVVAACGGDDLVVWTAQRLPSGGARAWAHGEAVVVACPAVSKHDRLAVFGAPGDPAHAGLVRRVWREMGTGYRPFGDRETIHRLVERMPGELGPAGNFTWMTVGPTRTGPTRTGPTRTGPTRTGPTRTGPTRTGPTILRLAFMGLALLGPTIFGLTIFGLTRRGWRRHRLGRDRPRLAGLRGTGRVGHVGQVKGPPGDRRRCW